MTLQYIDISIFSLLKTCFNGLNISYAVLVYVLMD